MSAGRPKRADAEALARWYERADQRPDAASKRNAAICRAWGSGTRMAALAREYSTSRQRIGQIIGDAAKGRAALAARLAPQPERVRQRDA